MILNSKYTVFNEELIKNKKYLKMFFQMFYSSGKGVMFVDLIRLCVSLKALPLEKGLGRG